MDTKDFPRLGDLTRDQYRQTLSLDYAKWLGCLAESSSVFGATKNYQARFPKSLGATLLHKSAIAPGTSTGADWAAPLASVKPLQEAFFALARSASLLGRIPGLRAVPFNTKIPVETAGATYVWVKENDPKPPSTMAFATVGPLGPTKCQAIIVLTAEVVKLSQTGLESVLRNTLLDGLTAFTDKSFLDPASTAIALTRPASVTAGTTPVTATASYATDVATLLTAFFTGRPNAQEPVLLANAGHASQLRTLNAGAGPGLPVVVSEAALGNTIALDPAGIFIADDGLDIDLAREASLQMDTAPTTPPDATTVYVSLWQENKIGYKVERFMNWVATANSVKYLAG